MADAFVEFRHVFAGYSSQNESVLRDISFSLQAQDHIVLFGPPASGKSTLLLLMSGAISPLEGTVIINGKKPSSNENTRLGYVSPYDTSNHGAARGMVRQALLAFGKAHSIEYLPARIGEVSAELALGGMMEHAASGLSASERIRLSIAYAALSDAPVILLDDVADMVGVEDLKKILATLFIGRCVCIATRHASIAEELGLPIYLLHGSSLAHSGSRESIAYESGVVRIVDAWVEGLRYDLLRKLRHHPGVMEVRLLPCDQFDGNRIRITLRNSRYLPSLYDVVSQASLVRIEELPPSLTDILATLS